MSWRGKRAQTRLAKSEADCEALKLRIKVIEAERDSLAAVIARDRERIRAEGAAYARQRAEAEGSVNNERIDTGIHRYSA